MKGVLKMKEEIVNDLEKELERQEKDKQRRIEKRKKREKEKRKEQKEMLANITSTKDIEARSGIENDYYGSPKDALKGRYLGSLCYYFFDESHIKQYGNSYNSVLVPPTEAVQSLVYYPFLDSLDFNWGLVDLDTVRFQLNDVSLVGKLRRIHTQETVKKQLGTFSCYDYNNKPVTPGGKFHWAKEGKLWQYPFTYSKIYDGLSEPMDFIPHLFKDGKQGTATVSVSQPISNLGTYSLYVAGYKGDTTGTLEGSVNKNAKNLPVVSSAYTDFMSSSQSQLLAAKENATQQAWTSGIVGTVSAVAGGAIALAGLGAAPFTGGTSIVAGGAIGGAVASVGTSIGSAMSTRHQTIKSLMAQEQDAKQRTNTLQDVGSDVIFSLMNSDDYLKVYRLQLPEQIMERYGFYFHLFGYAQNKLMTPNLRSRYYFNFVKAIDINIKSNGIPKHHLLKLKSIYEAGTTIWHVDRYNFTFVGDYSNDNYETN